MIKLTPEQAWNNYLLGPSKKAGWMEESKDISEELPISKRELFGLVILAHIANYLSETNDWFVGSDPKASEPNDGLISNGKNRIDIEHKLVPQMATPEALEAILSTYDKYAKRGKAYGEGRTLIIYGNKSGKGMIKISDLRKRIAESDCPFDNVLFIGAVAHKGDVIVMHTTEHYPENGIAQVDLNITNGEATVPHSDLKTFPNLIK